MADNIQVRDASGNFQTMRTTDTGGVHTPHQRISGYDSQDDMLKVKSVQKKFRDSFPGSALDATKWESVTGSGASITVGSGVLTLASGTTINAETYVLSKETFTVPFRVSTSFTLSQRIANQTFLVEVVSVDAVTGVPDGLHAAALVADGVTATQLKYRVQNSGITALDSAASTFPTTASGGVFEIEPFADECWFHGGTLDSTAGRANSYRRHQQIPDPNAVYKIRLRWLNGGTAPASTTSAVVQYVACQDYAELTAEITAGRGQVVAGQALGVAVVSAPTTAVSQSGTWTVQPGNTANTTAWLTRQTETLGTATALGALNANIAGALNGVSGIAAVITAISTPVGMTLTPQVSYDGGTNYVNTNFFDPTTDNVEATIPNASLAVGFSRVIIVGNGATHARVVATAWTSGSATVRLSASNAQSLISLKSGGQHDGVAGTYVDMLGAYASATAPTAVSANGDVVRLWATTNGALNIADAGGSLTVDGTVAATQSGTWTVQPGNTANTTPWLVTDRSNMYFNESTTALAASATLTGTTRGVGIASGTLQPYAAFNATAFADVAGTLRIEMSNDNVTWRRATADSAVAANAVVTLSVPVVTAYYRVVYVNGATLQTAFMVNSSFTAA